MGKNEKAEPGLAGQIRNRIVETRTLKGYELLGNDGNWRLHPGFQRDVLIGRLKERGITDVLLAYHSERNNGALTLIDGHLRQDVDPEIEWTVAILDLTDEEADEELLVHDAVTSLAEADRQAQLALAERMQSDDLAVRELVRQIRVQALGQTNRRTCRQRGRPRGPSRARKRRAARNGDSAL